MSGAPEEQPIWRRANIRRTGGWLLRVLRIEPLLRRWRDGAGPMLPILRKYAWSVPIVATLGLLSSLLEGLGIGLVVPALALISNTSPPPHSNSGILAALYRIPELVPEGLGLQAVCALIIVSVALKGLCQGASAMLSAWVDGQAAHEIRSRISSSLLTTGYPFFLSNSGPRLLNVLATESWRAAEAMRLTFTIVSGAVTLAVFTVLLFLVSWQLFIISVLGGVALRYIQSRTIKRIGRASDLMRDASEALTGRNVAVTSSIVKIARIFGQQSREYDDYKLTSNLIRERILQIFRVSAWHRPVFEISFSILFVSILAFSFRIGLDLPLLIAFLLLIYRMQPYVNQVSGAFVSLAGIRASVQEVKWLLASTKTISPPSGLLPFTALERSVRFDRVRFSYGGSERDEDAVSVETFELAKGVWTALDGPSGAGKSTIVNLLCRLIEPTSGRILVDDTDLRDLDPSSWLGALGVAGQDLELIQGTVSENIAYGAPGITPDEISRAVWLANLDEFIATLPLGYATRIGERGLALSGGQRQRIGLARALARRPSILVLDEATNALDARSEAILMDRLKAATEGVTVLVISHRSSTLKHCEAVVRVKGGLVTAAETFDDQG